MIAEVAQRLGARLKRVGPQEFAGPCPKCGGRDRFSLNTHKDVWNCRACGIGGDGIDLARHVLGLGFVDARRFVTGEGAAPLRPAEAHRRAPKPERHDEEGRDRALALWGAAIDPRGTLVEFYLKSRVLAIGDDIAGSVLRWHPGIGAMIALFRNIGTDDPQAISRAYLDPQARKIDRKFLGPVGGAAIKLDADENVTAGLHIAEGIETALAARELGLRPAWAVGSAGAIAAFPILPGVEALTLLAENDEASARAVEACAKRWDEARREVFINRAINGKDLNDAIRGAA